MLLLSFLISLSLSVAAIPLSPNHQSPRDLPLGDTLPLDDPTAVTDGLVGSVLRRFIMDADYASSPSPPTFFGKSPHKRADPLSNPFGPTTLRYNDVEEEIKPQLSPRFAPT